MAVVAHDGSWPFGAKLIVGLLVVAACVVNTASGVHLPTLELRSVQVENNAAQVAERRLELLGPNAPGTATMWEGPIRVSGSSADAPCTVAAELITGLFADVAGHAVLVVSQSGAATYLEIFELATCDRAAASEALFTAGIAVSGDRIEILPGCECADSPDACTCSAGRVLRVTPDLKLSEDAAASRELTRAHLGVGFLGEARVAHPGDPGVHILDD